MKGLMNGLDLFSGYGGITLALKDYVRPITYCEIEQYAQGILLSNFDKGILPFAPIWDNVTTLDGCQFKGLVDIIYGGFPCQDISSAGKGAGLEGKRSGLFYEILRLCKEASPQFVFLENVSNIRTKGSVEISEALASIGYDCRFGCISASEVGAIHQRERWFLLATNTERIGTQIQTDGRLSTVSLPGSQSENGKTFERIWPTESPVCGTDDVPANRSHRIKALGNGVVPLQVKTAFEVLMGIKE